MNRLTRLVSLLTIAATLASIASMGALLTAQAADPRREPATALKEAIRLLEKKDYVTFVTTFARPDELKELTAKRPLAEVAAEYGEKRAAGQLEALKAASALTPVKRPDGLRVDYQFEKPVGGESKITMVKIGELWYLR